VDLQDQHKHYEQLRAKYETLNTLLQPEDRGIPRVSDSFDDATHYTGSAREHSTTVANTAEQAPAAATPGGIAYREDDLYPSSLWKDPEYARLVSQASEATPIAALAIAAASMTRSQTQHDTDAEQPSSALRHLAQQYAQDDRYPVHGDADDHALHAGHGAAGTALTATTLFASPMLSAKASFTPARFQERLLQPAAKAGAKATATATVPATQPAVLSTPQRATTSAGKQNPYNSVNSTCSTPPVGVPGVKYAQPALSTKMHGYTATNASLTHMYPNISAPATYTHDAFASYLPGTRGNREQSEQAMDVASTPVSGVSRVPKSGSAPNGELDHHSSGFAPDLSRMDALLAHSRSIATSTAPRLSTAQVGGEYSTICRLTENFAPAGGRTPADESMLSGTAGNVSALLDTSSTSAHSLQSRIQQLTDSQDSLLPPPPPPSQVQFTQRQVLPSAAASSHAFASMPGTSPSDWLFNALAQVPQPASGAEYNSAHNANTTGTVRTPPRDVTQLSVKPPTPVPQYIVHTAAKSRSHATPATTDLYQQNNPTDPCDSPTGDETVDRLAQQFSSAVELGSASLPTPPPRAAVPDYLLSNLKQWAAEGEHSQTPELHGASSVRIDQMRRVRVSSHPVKVTQQTQNVVSVKRTTTTPPGSTQKPWKTVRQAASTASASQEAPSVIIPNSALPSPQAAPVHPFAHKQVRYGSELRSPTLGSNANTPTSVALEPRPLSGRVFDARGGSF
jgi:hypothetical protein